ncbi:MAG: hypothetical protein GY791_17690 [Alphaproteobacteria bacterium]|nr:hypothetical protein [Alphaproteobacteria bacterium]
MLARSTFCLLFALLLWPADRALGGPYGTTAEARALAEGAADLVRDIGIDRARHLLIDLDGPYVDRDLYIFVLDRNGIVQSHPDTGSIGGDALAARDPNGKSFVLEMVVRAEGASEGFWVEYVWLHPQLGTFATKRAWMVPVGDFIVGCGAYVGEAT